MSALHDTRYARLFFAQVIALIGTGLTTIALGLLAYDLAGGEAGLILGGLLAVKMVTYVVVAPVAGALAHRIPRRAVLVAMDLLRAATVCAMPFVGEVWQVFALVFMLNAASAAFTPTFQATIPDILEDEAVYTGALSLSRLAYDLEKLASPILTAGALMLVSYDGLFLANAVAFLVSAGLVSSVRIPPAETPDTDEGISRSLGRGAWIFLKTPRLRGLLALSMAVAAGGSFVIVNTVVIVRDTFAGGETAVATAFAMAGLGSMLVALALPRLLDRAPDRPVMLAGGSVLVVGLLLVPLISSLEGLLGVWFVLGAGSSLVQTPAGRLLRRSSGRADRPAVFAAQFALSHACWLVAYPLAGWTGARLDLDTAAMILAVITCVSCAAASRLWPPGDPIVLSHEHPAHDHDHPHIHDAHHQHEHEGWEGPEPHRHPHRHGPLKHSHPYVIDTHHRAWPEGA